MIKVGMPRKLISLVCKIYSVASAMVRIRQPDGRNAFSDLFEIRRGVLQGDIFSPLAFILGLDALFKKFDCCNEGFHVGVDELGSIDISRLEYADDVILVNSSVVDASTRVSTLNSGSWAEARMEIKLAKTKVMHVQPAAQVSKTTMEDAQKISGKAVCSDCHSIFATQRGLKMHRDRWGETCRRIAAGLAEQKFANRMSNRIVKHQKLEQVQKNLPCVRLGNEPLENVFTFDYLGNKVQADGAAYKDMEYRFGIARTRFKGLMNVRRAASLPMSLKLRLYKAAICSSMVYGCENWCLDATGKRKIKGVNGLLLARFTGRNIREETEKP